MIYKLLLSHKNIFLAILLIPSLICIGVFIGMNVVEPISFTSTIENIQNTSCDEEVGVDGSKWWAKSLSADQERLCLFKELEDGSDIVITNTMLGGISTERIRNIAKNGVFADDEFNKCQDGAGNNPDVKRCAYELEEKLYSVIGGVIELKIKEYEESNKSDEYNQIYVRAIKRDLYDWYVLLRRSNNREHLMCEIVNLHSIDGTSHGGWVSGCVIKELAMQILWLLDNPWESSLDGVESAINIPNGD